MVDAFLRLVGIRARRVGSRRNSPGSPLPPGSAQAEQAQRSDAWCRMIIELCLPLSIATAGVAGAVLQAGTMRTLFAILAVALALPALLAMLALAVPPSKEELALKDQGSRLSLALLWLIVYGAVIAVIASLVF